MADEPVVALTDEERMYEDAVADFRDARNDLREAKNALQLWKSDHAEQGYTPLAAELVHLEKNVDNAAQRLQITNQVLKDARAAAEKARSVRLSSKLRIAYDSILTNY